MSTVSWFTSFWTGLSFREAAVYCIPVFVVAIPLRLYFRWTALAGPNGFHNGPRMLFGGIFAALFCPELPYIFRHGKARWKEKHDGE